MNWRNLASIRSTLLAACLGMFVLGWNWDAANRFGSDIPDWDQWDAEGLHLLAPWFERDHFIPRLFEPHNEHRVVLTKLQNLAVVLVTGQWDSRVECFFNAMLHAALAVAVWALGRRWIPRAALIPWYVFVAVLYGAPLAWQNVLGGFHSQQYWLIGLSLLAIVVLPFAKAFSSPWWIGLTAAVLSLGSMASGFFAAATIVGLLAWRWVTREISWRHIWPTLLPMLALIAIGLATRVEVDYHAALKAKSVHDFIYSLLRSVEWPVRHHDWVGVIMWAPWVAVAIKAATRERNVAASGDAVRAERTLVALGAWVLAQLIATAYVRGAGAGYPASRYMDTLIFGVSLNAVGLIWWWRDPHTMAERGPKVRAALRSAVIATIALAWFVTLIVGLSDLLRINFQHELPDTAKRYRAAEAHLQSYLATNDRAELVAPIPYPDADALVARLSHASLRDRMPTSVRPPLGLEPAPESAATFAHASPSYRNPARAARAGISPGTPPLHSHPAWGSFKDKGLAYLAEWRSQPLVAPLHGWLKFETAGSVGEPGVSLALHDATSGALLAEIKPSRVPHDSWRSAYVKAPVKPFVIVARDEDPGRWLAFSAPVEMSNLSHLCWRLMKNGLLLAEIATGLAIAIAVALVPMTPRRRLDKSL